MQSYPYRLAGKSVKAKAGTTLKSLLNSWAQEWFVSPPPYEINIREANQPSAGWQVRGTDLDHWVACVLKEQAPREFMQLLFGPASGGAASAMVTDVLQAAIDDLMQRLMPNEDSSDSFEPEKLRTGMGSGALYIEIDGALPIRALALGGAWVEAASVGALPAPISVPKLTSRRALLGHGKVRLEVGLGEAELALPELAGIAVGDVLALDVPYRAPLQLKAEDGTDLVKVHLGRVDQHMAIQVISK